MTRFLSRLMVPFLMVSLMLGLAGCDGMDLWLRSSVDKAEGEVHLQGLSAPITIRRDEYGVPRIEASNEGDLAFGVGYAMASDRLAQMVSYSL
ncbi:MAG: penicillin acylase family protein, partial [Moraxellaceae bacterium]|nr:penicillin acylase family protein [Moraxellaceae bacterium]